MIEINRRLPAEWEEQDGVLMAWPHKGTEWSNLHEARRVTIDIAREITRFETLLLAAPDIDEPRQFMADAGLPLDRVRLFEVETNDTWARDFGPVTVFEGERPLMLDFGFNGWGLRFPSNLDNQITRKLAARGVFGKTPLKTMGLILEGGSIDSDGQGTILTTSACLLSPNRNPHLSRSGIEQVLRQALAAGRVLWINNGHLAGDDTDAHIDTLARFCPDDTIVFTACDDPADEHFAPLQAMAEELRSFRTADGRPYRLMALPWPDAVRDEKGGRLPATYANFLIVNGAVLVPTYGTAKDRSAIEVIGRAFPDRPATGIHSLPLLTGNGSLHCITMQIPRGVL
ncbi:MAG TPA: agmatine deiminase family protein [Syntrophobacteraceae bacterium]|nr:agmatine deiminase family protein [Syntrophobacteraceae bacterium]